MNVPCIRPRIADVVFRLYAGQSIPSSSTFSPAEPSNAMAIVCRSA